jgi:hypothetical protein
MPSLYGHLLATMDKDPENLDNIHVADRYTIAGYYKKWAPGESATMVKIANCISFRCCRKGK